MSYVGGYQDTGDIRVSLLLLAEQLNELERNPLFQKQANKNLDRRLFIITRDSYADLNETWTSSSGSKRNLSIRPLDAQHLLRNKHKIDELTDRLVWFNENTKTVSIMPQKQKESKKEKIEEVDFDIDIEVKQRGQAKAAKGTSIGSFKAHTVTKQELAEMNQAAIELRANLQLLASPPPSTENSPVGVHTPKILKQEETINPFERVFRTEEEKPARKRKKRVDKAKESEKVQKEIGEKARENRELRISGEKKAEAFKNEMKKGVKQKEAHRGRIQDKAKKMKSV